MLTRLSIHTGWYVTVLLATPMRSTSLVVARLTQRPQPVHDIFDPGLYYFRILSILCQRAIAFDHRTQPTCGVCGRAVPANASADLALSQNGGSGLAPGIEDCLQPLPESRVKRRHFLRQVVELTSAAQLLGP